MTPGRVLAELEALAARLGIAVRAEPFGKGVLEGRGGLCWLDGKPLVVMDQTLTVPERIAVLAAALAAARFDLEVMSVPPAVRERIEAARGGRTTQKSPSKKKASPAHPGLARAKGRGRS